MSEEVVERIERLKEMNKRRQELECQLLNYIAYLENENTRLRTEVEELIESLKSVYAERREDGCN